MFLKSYPPHSWPHDISQLFVFIELASVRASGMLLAPHLQQDNLFIALPSTTEEWSLKQPWVLYKVLYMDLLVGVHH